MFAIAVAGVVWIGRTTTGTVLGVGAYGVVAIGYLLLKLVASSAYRPFEGPLPHGLKVAVVVPVYNEDPEMLADCIRSLLAQSRPADEIYVVDDGSLRTQAYRTARGMLEVVPNGLVHRFDANRGKRHAQAWAFRRSDADVFLTVDSDTVLAPDAIAEGLRPMKDRHTVAVCGNVRVLNDDTNILTRLLSLRYTNSFVYERAAYSKVDSVLCSTGVCTFWRRSIILENLDDYLTQTFLGIEVGYGDDRRLTNYALERGRVVFQSTAVAYTLAPTRLTHLLRQQIRWAKSFFRETLFSIRHLPPIRVVWWLSVAELLMWGTFTGVLAIMLVIRPVVMGQLVSVYYLGFALLMAYARSARHDTKGLWLLLLAPLYALMHIVMFTPVRIWAILTLRDGSWGTRSSGIEVTAEGKSPSPLPSIRPARRQAAL